MAGGVEGARCAWAAKPLLATSFLASHRPRDMDISRISQCLSVLVSFEPPPLEFLIGLTFVLGLSIATFTLIWSLY